MCVCFVGLSVCWLPVIPWSSRRNTLGHMTTSHDVWLITREDRTALQPPHSSLSPVILFCLSVCFASSCVCQSFKRKIKHVKQQFTKYKTYRIVEMNINFFFLLVWQTFHCVLHWLAIHLICSIPLRPFGHLAALAMTDPYLEIWPSGIHYSGEVWHRVWPLV